MANAFRDLAVLSAVSALQETGALGQEIDLYGFLEAEGSTANSRIFDQEDVCYRCLYDAYLQGRPVSGVERRMIRLKENTADKDKLLEEFEKALKVGQADFLSRVPLIAEDLPAAAEETLQDLIGDLSSQDALALTAFVVQQRQAGLALLKACSVPASGAPAYYGFVVREDGRQQATVNTYLPRVWTKWQESRADGKEVSPVFLMTVQAKTKAQARQQAQAHLQTLCTDRFFDQVKNIIEIQ